jgi:hypothetical protein
MNFEEFEDKFKPIQNHLDSNAQMGGIMFDTSGEEFAFVQAQDPHNVWTVIVTDENPYDEFVDNYECEDCEQAGEDMCMCDNARKAADEAGLEPVWYICKGFHIVNRHGYIVSENPWSEDTEDAEY